MTLPHERLDGVRIVFDVDGTLCELKRSDSAEDYRDLEPRLEVVERLREYRARGAVICLYTARNMRTHENNVGRIMATTSRVLFEWLDRHQIPFDEIHFGKPYPGPRGFYVDDRAVRPSEFLRFSLDQLNELLALEHRTGASDD